LPLNINPQRIKNEFLSSDDPENKPFSSFEKSSFLNFFPKIKVKSENLKIICIPNFLLDDKNEQYIQLYKTEFRPIARLVQEVIKDNILVGSPSRTALNSRECLTEIEIQGVKTEGENISRNTDGIKLRKLNLQGIISQIEKARDFANKLKQIQKLKLDNSNNGSRIPTSNSLNNVVDSTQLIQRIVDEIKNKRESNPVEIAQDGEPVNIEAAVSSLIQNNNYLLKYYEKDIFYTNKNCYTDVIEITKFLEKSKDEEPEKGRDKKKSRYDEKKIDKENIQENQLIEMNDAHQDAMISNDEMDEIAYLKHINSMICLYLED